ncbi:alkaline phosphatase [Alteromonas sp. ASW11-130]|uniref:alkaline phosphatase n=1 Tax=Alteromonas sp. ASW11-130 TaxID=3015775 RepID=UPI0022419BF5|nr:alkaline phosphatase [Alteromonas sp. ASW11-130]MCW8091310.1 alkaline phosphatase [Alteromonas sp. ASW11-130]
MRLISTALLLTCTFVVHEGHANTKDSNHHRISKPNNIIMVVADGMGPAYTTAYRNFMDNPATDEVEKVIFDEMFVGNATTYPAKVSGYVTDSAASATALATGVKSYNGAIGVDVNRKALPTVLHRAKEKGMKTGLAVTSQINHATPASYMVANESRNNYEALANSYFDDRINETFLADVMLGGGIDYFARKDRNIQKEFASNGYAVVNSYEELANAPKDKPILGLFAPKGLPAALDDSKPERLAFLTEQAIKRLENPHGFFLLVEASQVDWAGHANDIASAMAEMHDLAKTMEYLQRYVERHPDTLVILTADHSTGGLTIGANGQYAWKPEFIANMKASVGNIAKHVSKHDKPLSYIEAQFGFTLSEEDKQTLKQSLADSQANAMVTHLKAFLDAKTHTGWTTGGHTGVDVEVFALGAGYEEFIGQIDNTDIAKKIFKLLEK